ncbi:urease accessory protein UreF [Sulfoacidibacillus ferrooxidans]|uniref:Urease accessory protein UreF n=1 Tax=Sulfoacidibacillus ferrooxidans TaxID=2005001 RepID=A0A9X1VD41_9BACL|nr:urease accessory UreF family protein [Sulfoacidibacillus ferrooxidans]MCI0183943.1 Urease accessory protein UreF [Sulfoacidibacillus ferrooxidans]
MDQAMLPLLQLADSSFPTGAFSHSFGLETALSEGTITSASDLHAWLEGFIVGSFATMEASAVYFSHSLLSDHIQDWNEIEYIDTWKEPITLLDLRMTLSKLARESRIGSVKIGRQYVRMGMQLYPDAHLQIYDQLIQSGSCFGNAAIAHGWVCSYLGVSAETAILTHLYTSVNALIQNAVRAAPIGQTQGQHILSSLFLHMEQVTSHTIAQPPAFLHLANAAILHEIQAMRHETLYSRLFMS